MEKSEEVRAFPAQKRPLEKVSKNEEESNYEGESSRPSSNKKRKSSQEINKICILEVIPNEILLHVFSYATTFDNRVDLQKVCTRFRDFMNDKSVLLSVAKKSIKGFSLEEPFDDVRQFTVAYAETLFNVTQTALKLKNQGKLKEVAELYYNALLHLANSPLITYRLIRFIKKYQADADIAKFIQEKRNFISSKSSVAMGFFYNNSQNDENKSKAFLKLFLQKNAVTRYEMYPDVATKIDEMKWGVMGFKKNPYVSSELLYLISMEDTILAPELKQIILEKSAHYGNVKAQYYLGLCYKDEKKAVKWYFASSKQGHAGAQCKLGELYAKGIGVEKDEKEAVKWYLASAHQGNAIAQYYVGAYYAEGIGVEKDEKEAVKWYLASAHQGNANAQCNLGFYYHNGIGVEEDEKEAVKWFQASADQGDNIAQYNLGWCYKRGIGVEKDKKEAMKWYQKSAEQGNARAITALEKLLKKVQASGKNIDNFS